MIASESRRDELYNGLAEILGSELTDTLMSHLPSTPIAALVTDDDFDTEIRSVKDEIRLLSQRVDRLQLTLVAGRGVQGGRPPARESR